jgi:hypothetical protein
MRIVLNSIKQEIKDAVMMGSNDRDSAEATQQVIEGADERAKRAREKAKETGLSAESGKAATHQEIIETSGLDGWETYCFPAFEKIGTGNRKYETLVSLETIESLFTQSEQIENSGWLFTSLRNHNRADDFDEVVDDTHIIEVA